MTTDPSDMTPATRHDVNTAAAELRVELKADMAELKADTAELKADMAELGRMLFAELARWGNAILEEVGRRIGILDDKLDHHIRELTALRQEHDAHVGDRSIHHTHARTRAKKRTRRARKS